MFVDQIKIYVRAGKGGNGCVSFRRTRRNPRGGPDGGDGGRGGDVIIRAQRDLYTLIDLRYHTHYIAPHGGHGSSNHRKGRNGTPCIIKVPVGTIVREAETGIVLADLVREGQEVIVARGGKGGRGNSYFKSSINRAPRQAEAGEAGEERWIQLELKLLADVGLLGMPNAGKSTLLNAISAAHPEIANYPFTTLTPNLGVVKIDDHARFVVADIPGLIPGAHRGKGLGHQFLRHIERTKLLLHVLDLSSNEQLRPWDNFLAINQELKLYNEELTRKPQIVAANKIDLPEARRKLPECRQWFEGQNLPFFPISAKTGEGIPELIKALGERLCQLAVLN